MDALMAAFVGAILCQASDRSAWLGMRVGENRVRMRPLLPGCLGQRPEAIEGLLIEVVTAGLGASDRTERLGVVGHDDLWNRSGLLGNSTIWQQHGCEAQAEKRNKTELSDHRSVHHEFEVSGLG